MDNNMAEFKIDEIARLKMSDARHIEMVRKKLGVTQRFFAEAIGTSGGNWGNILSTGRDVPEEYHDRIRNVVTALSHAINGTKVIPVNGEMKKKSEKKKELLTDIGLIKNFLEEVCNPEINALEDRETALLRILKRHAQDAKDILEIIESHTEKLI
jgi:DNA-binding transcriptional regulator YiaG